jgi:hypothetical protein
LARKEDEIAELRSILQDLRDLIIRRALAAWHLSPETFSDEIVALNDINQALKNLRTSSQ